MVKKKRRGKHRSAYPKKRSSRAKVLLIGARGKVGHGFVHEYLRNMEFRKRYELILGVHSKTYKNPKFKIRRIELLDTKSLMRAMKGVDVVINLAGNPNPPAEFKDLWEPNLIGAYNVFECAAKSGVKRVIFASSIHAVKGYGHGYQVKGDNVARPINLYGATKAFAEALCFTYSNNYDMSCLAIRIGAYTPAESFENVCLTRDDYGYVISERDMGQLLHRCVIAPKKVKYGILSGSSENEDMHLELEETKKLVGYKPKDNASMLCRDLKSKKK